MENGEETVALAMDQSLAYDIVDHIILLNKLQAIGLDPLSISLMKSYLEDRQQSIQVECSTSPPLHSGPLSVIQGSALSCTLYIIFTLYLPLIFDPISIKVCHEEQTNKPKSITYIDNNFITITKYDDLSLQDSLNKTIEKVEEYMYNNRLILNTDKTKLMVLSKSDSRRLEIKIKAHPKDITHDAKLKVIGIEIDHNVNWKFFLIEGPLSIRERCKKRSTF